MKYLTEIAGSMIKIFDTKFHSPLSHAESRKKRMELLFPIEFTGMQSEGTKKYK